MKIRLYSFLLAAICFLTSCLNLKSELSDILTDDSFPVNEQDCENLVTAAAYGPFRAYWGAMFTAGEDGWHVVGDMCTDVLCCKWTDNKWMPLNNVNFTPTTNACTRIYTQHINEISRMTLTFDRIAAVDLPQDVRSRMEAELYCGRGWLAFLLFDMYGPLQIADLETLKNPLSDVVVPRLTYDQTVKFIEDNLRKALEINALADNYSGGDANYGRFTNGLVHTILMKLYMHEKDWEKAEIEARELRNAKYGYGLQDEYKDVFTIENEGNSEIIWAATCSKVAYANTQMWLSQVLPSVYPTKNKAITKWDGYRMPWQFYNTFNKLDDKRLQVLVGEFVGTDGVTYNQSNPGTPLDKGALPIKIGEDPNDTGNGSQVDWVVYRYADVLLSLAEIIARQGSVTKEALDCINEVRTRAGINNLEMNTDFTSPEEFLDLVLLERGHELWAEGSRRSDLIRYGKFVEYAQKYNGSTTVKDYMVLMPLPQAIINEGKGQVIQNPGYND